MRQMPVQQTRKAGNELRPKSKLETAILLDIDGTLASFYQKGTRRFRPSALPAIRMLANRAPVYLWSIAGADNGERLTREFPELKPYIAGCFGKDEFKLHMVENPYCIDDEAVDPQVLECNHVIVDIYSGGQDSGLLLEASSIILDWLSSIGGKCG